MQKQAAHAEAATSEDTYEETDRVKEAQQASDEACCVLSDIDDVLSDCDDAIDLDSEPKMEDYYDVHVNYLLRDAEWYANAQRWRQAQTLWNQRHGISECIC